MVSRTPVSHITNIAPLGLCFGWLCPALWVSRPNLTLTRTSHPTQVQGGLSAIASRLSKSVPAGGFGRLWSAAYQAPRLPPNTVFASEPAAAAWRFRVAYSDLFGRHVGAQLAACRAYAADYAVSGVCE